MAKQRCGERECDESRGCGSNDCKQECECCRNWLGHPARVYVMLHHLHPARDGGTDAIQSQTRHRAENECKRGNHLRLYVKTVVEKPEPHDHNASSDNRLRNPQDDSDSKKRPASRPITDGLRTRDEGSDCIVEAKNADLADDISSRPGNGEYAECRRP